MRAPMSPTASLSGRSATQMSRSSVRRAPACVPLIPGFPSGCMTARAVRLIPGRGLEAPLERNLGVGVGRARGQRNRERTEGTIMGKKLSLLVLVGVALAFQIPQIARGQLAECRADRERFCQDVPLGGGRVLRCLEQHAGDLSDGCRRALGTAAPAGGAAKRPGGGQGGGRGGRGVTTTPWGSVATPSETGRG